MNGPTYDVRAHGAAGDGYAKDTDPLQAALDSCHRDGGGSVLVPPGTYRWEGRLNILDRDALIVRGMASARNLNDEQLRALLQVLVIILPPEYL